MTTVRRTQTTPPPRQAPAADTRTEPEVVVTRPQAQRDAEERARANRDVFEDVQRIPPPQPPAEAPRRRSQTRVDISGGGVRVRDERVPGGQIVIKPTTNDGQVDGVVVRGRLRF